MPLGQILGSSAEPVAAAGDIPRAGPDAPPGASLAAARESVPATVPGAPPQNIPAGGAAASAPAAGSAGASLPPPTGALALAAGYEAGLPKRAPTLADREVGIRIRKLRREASCTLKDLAARIGVTHTQLHRYETGASRVATGRLIAIARALNVRVEDLVGGSPAAPPATAPHADEFAALARAFAGITDPRRRFALVSLAFTMAGVASPETGEGD